MASLPQEQTAMRLAPSGEASAVTMNYGGEVDSAVLSLGLRLMRRLLATLALVAIGVQGAMPAEFVMGAILLCWLEGIFPTSLLRDASFQQAFTLVSYLSLPFFLFMFFGMGTGNPAHEALISFLVLFQIKWVFAPRRDFHWLAALILLCLSMLTSQNVLAGGLLIVFAVLSLPYLSGMQDLHASAESLESYLQRLRHRRRLRVGTLSWAFPMLLVMAIAFFGLPRTPYRQLGFGGATYSGLTDSVSLHTAGGLQKDYTAVARLRLLSGSAPPQGLYLRAGFLDTVSDSDWTFYRIDSNRRNRGRSMQRRLILGDPDRRTYDYFDPDDDTPPAPLDFEHAAAYRLTVTDPTFDFFVRLGGTYRVRVATRLRPGSNDFASIGRALYPLTFDGRAIISPLRFGQWFRSLPHLSVDDQAPTEGERRLLTHWPGNARDVADFRTLGDTWTRELENPDDPIEVASAIATNLRRRYRYDLDPLRPPVSESVNPLIYFLLDPNYMAGHCELFAASMVGLLRVRGIPARLANGFRGGDYDQSRGDWVVRRSNAHTWVEVWDERLGWLSFDPTPDQVMTSYQGRFAYKLIKDLYEAMERRWQMGVVHFDADSQRRWWRDKTEQVGDWFGSVRDSLSGITKPFAWFAHLVRSQPILRRWFWLMISFQALLLLIAVVRIWRGRGSAVRGIFSGAGRKSVGWREVEIALGVGPREARRESETYREALDRMMPSSRLTADPLLRRELVDWLETVRYGGASLDAARTSDLMSRLRRLP